MSQWSGNILSFQMSGEPANFYGQNFGQRFNSFPVLYVQNKKAQSIPVFPEIFWASRCLVSRLIKPSIPTLSLDIVEIYHIKQNCQLLFYCYSHHRKIIYT